MGYGVFTIVHDTLHHIPNIIHHHSHDHHHHHVEDHNAAFESLKKMENNETPIHSPLKIIFLLNYITENSVFVFANNGTDIPFHCKVKTLANTHVIAPPTPPPIQS
ncbi:hypothetical protein GCM10009122_21340 [Fulvivirga kasyanovii]